MLGKDLIEMIFKADGDEEYSVQDDPITAELLEDGSFLKRAIGICNRNRTQRNLIKPARILRDSWVWVPYMFKGKAYKIIKCKEPVT